MFGFQMDRKMMYVVIGLLLLVTFSGYITRPESFLALLLTIPGVLIAITFHEFAHAYVADKLGDQTPRMQGRVSLNPLVHLDPIGSIMLLVAGFGWGKPVQINPSQFNRNISMDKGEALVSLAGPAMNFIIAIVATLLYGALQKYTQVSSIVYYVLMYTITINVGLGVFNLIPIYPLDGSKILKNFLPYNAKAWFENKEGLFYIIFIILWVSGFAGQIITPVIGAITKLLFKMIGY